MRHAYFTLLALAVLASSPLHAQTATDLGEGLRVTKNTTTELFSLSWWGKTGRTYFVQTSKDLVNWSYLPMVESGAGSVKGIEFGNTEVRQFWRLQYTDESTGGLSGANADFDGDGLANLAELNFGTDPFKADTDEDGWNDLREFQRGSNGINANATPVTVNPNYINSILNYDVQQLHGYHNYYMSRGKNSEGKWGDWSWSSTWNYPGDVGSEPGTGTSRPSLELRDFPYPVPSANVYWSSSGSLLFQQSTPSLYVGTQPSTFPYAQTGLDTYDGTSFQAENSWRGFDWYRYRIHLSETLPFDHQQSFLAVKWRYEKNPDYGVTDAPTAEYRWKRMEVDSVAPMTLSIPANSLTGTWSVQSPLAATPDSMYVVQVAPVTLGLRANLNKLSPSDAAAMFTPAPENSAHDNMVLATGVDQLGELPMGMGRGDGPGNAYCAPVEVYAAVPDIPSISWRWERHAKGAWWKISVVQLANGGHELAVQPMGNKDENDRPFTSTCDVTRSNATGRIYTGDSSGVNLTAVAAIATVGDFHYEERQFEYWLECTVNGSTFEIGRTKLAQRIAMRRIAQTGILANDFLPLANFNFFGELDLQITDTEAREIVRGQPANP